MKNKSVEQLEQEYSDKYGKIPLDKKDILKYLENNFKLDMNNIENEKERIKNLPTSELEIIIPVIPRPTPRPRNSNGHFYVPGAAVNKKMIKKYIDMYNIIYTKTDFKITTYQPIPLSAMKRDEIYLAELGYIEPMQNPDWDNLGKTYCDAVQGILLLNDNIVTKGSTIKHFSVKPRVIINIKYQVGFDSNYNKKRITNSTSYVKAVEEGLIHEFYA